MVARPLAAAGVLLLLALAGCAGRGGDGAGPAPQEAARDDAWALAGSPALDAQVRVVEVGHDFYEPAFGITGDGTWAVCCVGIQDDDDLDVVGLSGWTLVSRDQGATWEPAHQQMAPSFDPMLAVDPVTDRIYELNMLGVSCSNLAYSDDEGRTWTDRPMSCAVPAYDFLKLGAGLPGPDLNPLAGAAYPSVLYQCRNVNELPLGPFVLLSSWCAVSYDGGLTWPVDREVAVNSRDDCGGVTSFPVVGPDGTAVLPVGNGCPTLTLGISRDSGLTWSIVKFPGEGGMMSVTPQARFDDAGRLYVLWQDFEGRMNLARTDDLGATWHGPWNVTPPGARALVFDALQAGAEGRLAMAFFASDQPPESFADVPQDAAWHLYMATVEDGHTDEPSIALYRGSPADDPVQVGPVCFGGSTCTRNHGDFFTAATGPDGRFHLAFVDGCTQGCAGVAGATNEDSRASEGRVAVLDGWALR